MSLCRMAVTVIGLACMTAPVWADDRPAKIRIGMIGCDTSHAVAFPKIMNDPAAEGNLADCQIVAALPMKSPDLTNSVDRIDGYIATLREMGIEIVDSMEDLLSKVDAVMIEAVDGRPHLAQARPVIAAGKPLFIDKPVAASLADALEIYRLAAEAGVPVFSASSLRFSPDFVALTNNPQVGDIVGCVAYSPCSLDSTHPDLFWYGIHGVETLFTIMGPGCVAVQRTHTAGTDVVTGIWNDGRVGTFRGLRDGKTGYGAIAFGAKGIGSATRYGGYQPLVVEIAAFFKTGKPPVSPEETLEIIAFMEAADESKRQGGAPVTLQSVRASARK